MKSVKIELTDPSKELATLGELFASRAGGHSTIIGLSQSIGISLDDPEFLDVLAAIQRRIRDVESLAKMADDSDFDQEMRNDVLSAVRSFAQLVHPKNAHTGRDQIRSSSLPANNITALKFFSQTARRYRPLRLVSAKAQEEALKKIDEVIKEVRSDDDLQDWMKTVLVTGLERIALVLKHLQFFGHEAAITELLLAHQKLSVISDADGTTQSNSNGFQQTLVVLSVIGGLFVLPDEGVTAFNHYRSWTYTWSSKMLHAIIDSQIPTKQRLLPAPDAISSAPKGDSKGEPDE